MRKSFGNHVCALTGAMMMLLQATSVHAAEIEIPVWDMAEFCKKRLEDSWRVHKSTPNEALRAAAMSQCVETQVEALARVRVHWIVARQAAKENCVEYVMSDPPPSYFRLDVCIARSVGIKNKSAR